MFPINATIQSFLVLDKLQKWFKYKNEKLEKSGQIFRQPQKVEWDAWCPYLKMVLIEQRFRGEDKGHASLSS